MARIVLKEEDWKRLEPLLPSHKGKQGRPPNNNRLFIEAILWIKRTGAPWRDLPSEFGPWKTTYNRFNRWTKLAVWEEIWKV